jgi:hypothetical protein
VEILGEDRAPSKPVAPDTARITKSITGYAPAVAAGRPKHFQWQTLFPHVANCPGWMFVAVFFQILGCYASMLKYVVDNDSRAFALDSLGDVENCFWESV